MKLMACSRKHEYWSLRAWLPKFITECSLVEPLEKQSYQLHFLLLELLQSCRYCDFQLQSDYSNYPIQRRRSGSWSLLRRRIREISFPSATGCTFLHFLLLHRDQMFRTWLINHDHLHEPDQVAFCTRRVFALLYDSTFSLDFGLSLLY